jgi:hypothetical protein
MRGRRVFGAMIVGLSWSACGGPPEPAPPEPAPPEPVVTATVLSFDATGNQVARTETFAADRYAAMVAAREAEQGPAASAPPAAAGPGLTETASALTSSVSCSNGAALWLWTVPNGWNTPNPSPQMLCLLGAGTFDLASQPGFSNNIRSVWAGTESGGIYPGGAVGRCSYDCVSAPGGLGFLSGASVTKKNTPACVGDGRFVELQETHVPNCWVP